ncbi:hypothetical protein ACHAWF_017491 [Thalassiosira exigua]
MVPRPGPDPSPHGVRRGPDPSPFEGHRGPDPSLAGEGLLRLLLGHFPHRGPSPAAGASPRRSRPRGPSPSAAGVPRVPLAGAGAASPLRPRAPVRLRAPARRPAPSWGADRASSPPEAGGGEVGSYRPSWRSFPGRALPRRLRGRRSPRLLLRRSSPLRARARPGPCPGPSAGPCPDPSPCRVPPGPSPAPAPGRGGPSSPRRRRGCLAPGRRSWGRRRWPSRRTIPAAGGATEAGGDGGGGADGRGAAGGEDRARGRRSSTSGVVPPGGGGRRPLRLLRPRRPLLLPGVPVPVRGEDPCRRPLLRRRGRRRTVRSPLPRLRRRRPVLRSLAPRRGLDLRRLVLRRSPGGGGDPRTDRGDHPPLAPPLAADLAAAAFPVARRQIDAAASRRRRRAARRIYVHFYDGYADAVAGVLGRMRSRRGVGGGRGGATGGGDALMSLRDVPAWCVLPRTAASGCVERRARPCVEESFGDDDLGALSPYCVCVGDGSSVRRRRGEDGDRRPLSFDSDELEVRLAEPPPPVSADPASSSEAEEFVINLESVLNCKEGYAVVEGEMADGLARRFRGAGRGTTSTGALAPGFRPGGIAAAAARRDEDDDARGDDGTNPRVAPRAGGAEGARPRSFAPLGDLRPMLRRSGSKKVKGTVSCRGVVLGFSPPSTTRTREWMMSVVLVDETLPPPPDPGGDRSRDAAVVAGDPRADEEGDAEVAHVPSVTLVLFSKDRSGLPDVRSAGEVMVCERVFLQSFRDEPQLLGRKTSRIVVLRPRGGTAGGGERRDAASPDGWTVSCSCHDGAAAGAGGTPVAAHADLPWRSVDELWRWGRRRLAERPTVAPACRLTIGRLGHANGSGDRNVGLEAPASGDLTATVTAIIPVPERLRRRDTPRGYLRLWDGTGPSRSDPFPPEVAADPNDPRSRVNDPPERVLTRVAKALWDSSSSEGGAHGDGPRMPISAPIVLCGRVVNAVVWEENLWSLVSGEGAAEVGAFVRLRNVNEARLPSGVNCLSVHSKSSLTPLPSCTYEVAALLRAHDARVRAGALPNPTSAILPAGREGENGRGGARGGTAAKEGRGLSTIEACLHAPPPASFAVQFEVARTVPPCDLAASSGVDAMRALCATNRDGTIAFRFALRVRDASAEMDVLCLGATAERILGVRVRDFAKGRREGCEEALATLREATAPGSVCEGQVRSTLGRDGKVWFLLESICCIAGEDSA